MEMGRGDVIRGVVKILFIHIDKSKNKKVMKKAIITLVISLFSLSSVSAKSEVVSTVKNAAVQVIDSTKVAIDNIDTSSNFKMIYNDAKAGLEGLGKALKVGAEHVYVVLVRQQLVKSITGTIIIGLLIFFMVIFLNSVKMVDQTKGDDSYQIIRGTIFGLLSFVFLLYVVMSGKIPEVVTGYVNPEYGAIESIFDFVKNNTK
jgi:hypothetical protein